MVKRFSTKRPEEPIEIEDEKGLVKNYTVRGVDGTFRDQYLNASSKKMKQDVTGKVIGVNDYTGLYSDLLCMCVYNSDGQLCSPKEIQSWSSQTQQGIFEIAQVLSGLDKMAQETAKKNLPESGLPGSS